MSGKAATNTQFKLAFGGDEFDYSTFNLKALSLIVSYVGSQEHEESGVQSILYEFETDGKTLLYADGKSVGTSIYLSLSEPPGLGTIDGQTARVAILSPTTGKVLGVGRACLWRV